MLLPSTPTITIYYYSTRKQYSMPSHRGQKAELTYAVCTAVKVGCMLLLLLLHPTFLTIQSAVANRSCSTSYNKYTHAQNVYYGKLLGIHAGKMPQKRRLVCSHSRTTSCVTTNVAHCLYVAMLLINQTHDYVGFLHDEFSRNTFSVRVRVRNPCDLRYESWFSQKLESLGHVAVKCA